jgi:hypothetical protein
LGALAAAALALPPTVAWSQSVGSAAAVRPSSTGAPPGAAARALQIGTSIVLNERIRTNTSGSLQVMFVDKTSLTVGPNSDLVIDTFVYSPATGAGQFSVNLANGALRFIGGQISRTSGATINTPVAVVGVRGSGATVDINAGCPGGVCEKYVCLSGTCPVVLRDGSGSTILTPGEVFEVRADGTTREYQASSVTLSVAQTSTGTTSTQSSQSQSDPPSFGSSGFGSADPTTGEGTVAQTIIEQEPEPPPPPVPPPPCEPIP